MMSLLLLGFVLGMRHALEADHLAAIATLSARSHSPRHSLQLGMVWGLGHTLSLLAFGSAALWLDSVVPHRLAQWLELGVGVMLTILGADLVRKVIRDRIHYHRHRHSDGTVHFHAHTHRGESNHESSAHEHEHIRRFPLRALFVGLTHGMAGSAALILLTLETVRSPWTGMLYILLFGCGSILGMGALSVIVALPLRHSPRGLTWLQNGLQAALGMLTLALGLFIVAESGGALA